MLKKIAFLLLLIAPMSVFAQKFAHFKSMDIIPVMPEYAKAQTDIQTMQKQYEPYDAKLKRIDERYMLIFGRLLRDKWPDLLS